MGQHSSVAYLLPDPAAPNSTTSFPTNSVEEILTDADQTYPALARGKLKLHKMLLAGYELWSTGWTTSEGHLTLTNLQKVYPRVF